YSPLTLKVPHAVSVLLLQQKHAYMSPARHLSCKTVLLSQPHITIERCVTLNPATLLPTAEDGNPHDCVAETDKTMAARADLRDMPFPAVVLTIFVDGSSKKNLDGSTATAYTVVTAENTLKAQPLLPHYSAKAAELSALIALRTHTHAKDPVSLGNHKADEAAKQAALQQPSDTFTIEELDLTILKDMQHQAPKHEKRLWLKHGAKQTDEGLWENGNMP